MPDLEMPTSQTDEQAARNGGMLIDLSSIDMDQVMLSRADIEKWNPHRGPIVQLDAVIYHDAKFTQAVGYKDVRDDEFWVGGHFPGRPVMPGVLMVEAGAQLSSFLFYARRGEPCLAGFTRIQDTVFRDKVVPGERLLLLSREVTYRPRRFVSRVQGIVRDRIVFESTITGMTI